MKIYKITEASEYLGISINSLKTLANNGKLNSFKTGGEHRRFREDDLDTYMGVKKAKQERELLQEKFGYNLDKYTGIDKRKVLRNAVVPELGLHVFNAAQKETVQEALL